MVKEVYCDIINKDLIILMECVNTLKKIGQYMYECECPDCKGRGAITTELVFMDPVTTVCEYCNGTRYSNEALIYNYKGKNIVDVLNMSVEDAVLFFSDNKKIMNHLQSLMEVGLPYISFGQPLSTFSGGERQRVKLAQNIKKKGNIYILDEPTTGLHASDITKVMEILEGIVESKTKDFR